MLALHNAPWEFTKHEYNTFLTLNLSDEQADIRHHLTAQHATEVKNAIREGLRVRREVAAEYEMLP
jgi:hypothetical protein